MMGMAGTHRANVTMKDVARRAGVSPQTVSNVVNERAARVSEDTRLRVIESIAALGYRVNQSARSLRRGRTGTVGLGLPTLDSEYYGALAEALSDRFLERGLRLVIETTGGAVGAEMQSLASSRLDSYDGFVLALAAGDTDHLVRIDTDTPVVLLGERALSSQFDHVVMDNIGGGRRATEFLLQRGARRVVALGGSDAVEESMPALRTRGYLDAHVGLGVDVDRGLIVASSFDMAGGHEGIRRLLELGRSFDAVFAMTDAIALGAIRALADAGIRVPGDVQVIGFDDTRAGRYSVPRLSTIEPGNEARADTIVDLLMSRMSQPSADLERRVVVHPTRLLERESTSAPPSGAADPPLAGSTAAQT